MTAPPLPGTAAALVQPGMLAWPPFPDHYVDNEVIRPGGLVLTVEDGVAHCVTGAFDDMRCRPLGLRRSELPVADVGTVDMPRGEPAKYIRRCWKVIGRELETRRPNWAAVEAWRDLIDTIRRLP